MRAECEKYGDRDIADQATIQAILSSSAFVAFTTLHTIIVCLDRVRRRYSLLTFNHRKAYAEVNNVKFRKARIHTTYDFCKDDQVIFWIRYGGRRANALQRGPWSDTRKAVEYFTKLIDWRSYRDDGTFVEYLTRSLFLGIDKLKELMRQMRLLT
jgi:hypothetical protein